MSDDLTKKGSKDRKNINIHEPWELRDWATKLNVSKDKLIKAVKAVGTAVNDVKEWLANN